MSGISIFEIFKIGVGPSSSHTMGPWKAAQAFSKKVDIDRLKSVVVDLYGSLSKTGVGHGTDLAVMLGLSDFHVKTIDTNKIDKYITNIKQGGAIKFRNEKLVDFNPEDHIIFNNQMLPFHPNGISFTAIYADETIFKETYYSIGGGFICQENEDLEESNLILPCPINSSEDLKKWVLKKKTSFSKIVLKNELSLRNKAEFEKDLFEIWDCMQDSIYRGSHRFGILPGGLNVDRRAPKLNRKLIKRENYKNLQEWKDSIMNERYNFSDTLKWVSCFALAVNEENAAFGRVVTAPTNGAAGVIPAVLMYHHCFNSASKEDILKFLLVSGEIGSLFKKGATISAAMGGCQAEIGVSSSMAAAGLTAVNGGNTNQILMAAEIAMEHHLGMTCDPVNGLVQIPCIERNTMGAIKAITACQIALSSDPKKAKVSLDKVIKTMWETSLDMNTKYKETSDGGLAKVVNEMIVEC
ncbi:L-serine ammonia-lyase [Portibacter lacus]|uniref:L-serine dehydratase n=1 Tax=Portibacter lacus TaxID=1099794 RepID=A0AA37WFX0_9BACT|nr:L-serine ammonia-lyase [Portibacter lacus]GLR17370.1 L-serine ammonia-lyase [Portibacter lacus]